MREPTFKLTGISIWHLWTNRHLHLTDDQGWRLEVPSRPRLTSVGAYRYHVERSGRRRRRYGGFYSTADLARLVSYCEVHGVRVSPP